MAFSRLPAYRVPGQPICRGRKPRRCSVAPTKRCPPRSAEPHSLPSTDRGCHLRRLAEGRVPPRTPRAVWSASPNPAPVVRSHAWYVIVAGLTGPATGRNRTRSLPATAGPLARTRYRTASTPSRPGSPTCRFPSAQPPRPPDYGFGTAFAIDPPANAWTWVFPLARSGPGCWPGSGRRSPAPSTFRAPALNAVVCPLRSTRSAPPGVLSLWSQARNVSSAALLNVPAGTGPTRPPRCPLQGLAGRPSGRPGQSAAIPPTCPCTSRPRGRWPGTA